MRHLGMGVVVGAAICSASTAHAAEHLMHVSEVLVSSGGDPDIRFVELADPSQEPFPNSYKLVVYNSAGVAGETVNLTIAANTQRILIGTDEADAAFTTTKHFTLTAALPADGHACFERADINSKIHCVTWGCVTSLMSGAIRAPSPPDGSSIQRQSNGFYQVATPTPDDNNIAGTTQSNCPSEPDAPPPLDGPMTGPDAGMMPDALKPDAGPGGNNNPDDGGGCCQVDDTRGAVGAILLALGVLLALRRSRTR